MKRLSALLVCLLAACVVKKENPVDTLAASSTTSTTSVQSNASVPETSSVGLPSIGASVAAPTPKPETPASTSWTVTAGGIGPLRAGMTVAEANKAVGGGFAAPAGADPACSYAKLTKAPDGLAVMLENNKIARVEVRNGTIATAEGARIGDTESRINSLYGGRVTTSPHKYATGGHYLTVTPVNDTTHRIVFETDGKAVTSYRAGVLPAVEFVERCG
ncbi:MAG: hypothetical protein ACJ8AK_16580 [Gemmatimonadaceae bacterium]